MMSGDIHTNRCYRGAPCLFAEAHRVSREEPWDYYDRRSRSYVSLECRLHQKYWTDSPWAREEEENFRSGLSSQTREHPDLQLHDSNGVWFTHSDDPEYYAWDPDSEDPKTCSVCEVVCEIRDWEKYLNLDGTCPYPDPAPQLIYKKVEDYDQPCQDFLHPLLLQDIAAINRKRRRAAKAHIWKYLKQPKYMHRLINKQEPMQQVWRRNYQPVRFYYSSFLTLLSYIHIQPPRVKYNPRWLGHIRTNLDHSPSFQHLMQDPQEAYWLSRIDHRLREARGESPRSRLRPYRAQR